uniref:Putative ovule protein n=1 Tax=Solanum chacoense TaxID=4108 RepID=A0A0V0H7H7_SOLCH
MFAKEFKIHEQTFTFLCDPTTLLIVSIRFLCVSRIISILLFSISILNLSVSFIISIFLLSILINLSANPLISAANSLPPTLPSPSSSSSSSSTSSSTSSSSSLLIPTFSKYPFLFSFIEFLIPLIGSKFRSFTILFTFLLSATTLTPIIPISPRTI